MAHSQGGEMELISIIIGSIGALVALFGGVCAVVVPVAFLAAFGIFFYRRSQQAKATKVAAQSWAQTNGIVLQSSVQTHRSGNSTSVVPVVVYQYQVDGKTYQNQTIKAGDKYMAVRVSWQARSTVDKYPIGAAVKVYYDPANPKDSALER
jgi:hypothetical protein